MIKDWDEIFAGSAYFNVRGARAQALSLREYVAKKLVSLARELPEYGNYTMNDCDVLAEDIRLAAIEELEYQIKELSDMSA